MEQSRLGFEAWMDQGDGAEWFCVAVAASKVADGVVLWSGIELQVKGNLSLFSTFKNEVGLEFGWLVECAKMW